jgi:hypothetical protein
MPPRVCTPQHGRRRLTPHPGELNAVRRRGTPVALSAPARHSVAGGSREVRHAIRSRGGSARLVSRSRAEGSARRCSTAERSAESHELGFLARLNRVSASRGGSIHRGVLATVRARSLRGRRREESAGARHPAASRRSATGQSTAPANRAGQPLLPGRGPSDLPRRRTRSNLYDKTTLQEPHRIDRGFVFQRGRTSPRAWSFRFSMPLRPGDYRIGLIRNPTFPPPPLGGASAVTPRPARFHPFLSQLVVKTDPGGVRAGFLGGEGARSLRTRSTYRERPPPDRRRRLRTNLGPRDECGTDYETVLDETTAGRAVRPRAGIRNTAWQQPGV